MGDYLGVKGKLWCTPLIEFPVGQCPEKVYFVPKAEDMDGITQVQWNFPGRIMTSDAFKE